MAPDGPWSSLHNLLWCHSGRCSNWIQYPYAWVSWTFMLMVSPAMYIDMSILNWRILQPYCTSLQSYVALLIHSINVCSTRVSGKCLFSYHDIIDQYETHCSFTCVPVRTVLSLPTPQVQLTPLHMTPTVQFRSTGANGVNILCDAQCPEMYIQPNYKGCIHISTWCGEALGKAHCGKISYP